MKEPIKVVKPKVPNDLFVDRDDAERMRDEETLVQIKFGDVKSTTPKKAFEYMNANVGGNIHTLNELGKEGWRVINIERGFALLEREYTFI